MAAGAAVPGDRAAAGGLRRGCDPVLRRRRDTDDRGRGARAVDPGEEVLAASRGRALRGLGRPLLTGRTPFPRRRRGHPGPVDDRRRLHPVRASAVVACTGPSTGPTSGTIDTDRPDRSPADSPGAWPGP